MAEQAPVYWLTCDHDGCIGIRLDVGGMCLAHVGEEEREAKLRRIGETGLIDLRGVSITSELFEQVIATVPRDANEKPLIKDCYFDNATFQGPANFDSATFEDMANFDSATFEDIANFENATFQGDASFEVATFPGLASFSGATFRGDARFGAATFQGEARFDVTLFRGDASFPGATFQRVAQFSVAIFQRGAWFTEATFQGEARFHGAIFQRGAWFTEATFQGDARFGAATFQGEARFDAAIFQGDAWFGHVEFRHAAEFSRVSFERMREFGPLLALRGLVLDEAQFAQPARIEVSTIGVCCRGARFPAGAQFRLRWARVVLDDADFPAPSILTGIPRLTDERLAARETHVARAWQRLLGGEISERPRLLSLQRANVAGLGLSNIDMADCQFAGAHNLDKLRLEADLSFATAPSRLGRLTQGSSRLVIAEERAWRANQSRRWAAPQWPEWPDEPEPPITDPSQIAGLYRALRKGREDIKDEPGAADFYYGEMEMRRHAHRPVGSDPDSRRGASWGRVERSILTAYWLVSGYGLRAWRALATLVAVVLLAGGVFAFWGFAPPDAPTIRPVSVDARGAPIYARQLVQRPAGVDELSHGVRFSAQAATALLRGPDQPLTALGEWLYMALRLLGPVLLGLAILALRGRVKR